MIKTKSVYKPIDAQDGTRILISRLYPRGTKKDKIDQWYKDLSPSMMLIKRYKSGRITWKRFLILYKKEISENPDNLELIKAIRRRSENENITLLCFEPDGEPCHRHVLRETIKKSNFLNDQMVPEFTDK